MKKLMATVFALGMSACALAPGDQADPQAPDEDQAMSPLEIPSATPGDAKARLAGVILPRNAACGTVGPNRQNQVIADAASPSGGANQRNGSSTGCPSLGVLQPTDDARYFCWTLGNDGFTWTFAQNQRTGVRGWTRDNLLRNNGSNANCGF